MQGWDDIPVVKKQVPKKPQQQQQQQQQPQQQQAGGRPRFINSKKQQEESKENQEKAFNPERDDKGETDIIFRSKKGVFLSKYYLPNSQQFPQYLKKIEENSEHIRVTKNGEIAVLSGPTWIATYSIKDQTLIEEITDLVSVQNIHLSKTEKFVQFVDRELKDRFVIKLVSFPDLKVVKVFEDKVYVKENFPPVKMTDDDETAFKYHYEKQVINVFKFNDEKVQVIRQFPVGVIEHFEVAPNHNENPLFSVCKVQIQKGYQVQEGKIQIYELNNIKPLVYKQMEKAQEIIVKWSPDGENLLLKVEKLQDQSNQSYYGENRLYHFNTKSNEFIQVPTYKGPVHDFQWSPDSERFCAISGFIPAHSVLFKNDCKPEFEFGQHYRNSCYFSNLNRFLILAGFGNLNGEIDIWDIKARKQVGKCKSSSASSCLWSNDGRKFMTGVVTPRLRVDNNFKIFKYDGTLLHKSNFNDTELYEVLWYNDNNQVYEDRPASPGKEFDEKKQEEEEKPKEKKVFKAFGGGGGSSFADQLRQMKGSEANDNSKGKVLSGKEDFGRNLQNNGAKKVLGQAVQQEQKPKKKRIRKKDMQKMLGDLEKEADNL